MRTVVAPTRTLLAALLALMLAARLLSPAGFMPAFEHGSVSIVACPDYEPAAAPMMHHQHGSGTKKLRQPCPFASAPALGTVGEFGPLLVTALLLAAALLLGRPSRFLERHSLRERPPLRGPPVTA